MRWWCLGVAALVSAGCSFDVLGTNVDPGGGSSPPAQSPTQSIPTETDAGVDAAPATDPTPPPPAPPTATPDMAQERIGIACKNDGDCDPGLICAQSFLVGLIVVQIPNGYCTHECGSSACPANSFCGSFSFGKYCLSSCPPDPCRNNYQCCANSKMNACLPNDLCPGG
jgi:hypothetical protein